MPPTTPPKVSNSDWNFRTFDELIREVLSILPDATIDQDADGQLVINTGLALISNTTRKDVLIEMRR